MGQEYLDPAVIPGGRKIPNDPPQFKPHMSAHMKSEKHKKKQHDKTRVISMAANWDSRTHPQMIQMEDGTSNSEIRVRISASSRP
jgi:hypothetical protein